MSSTAWKEAAYDETWHTTIASLRRRRLEDPTFSLDDTRGILRHLYIQEGNDWVGRGELQDIKVQATIAAHESFLAEWEAETRGTD